MKSKRFSEVLRSACANDPDVMEAILARYMPLINKHSTINGKLDEDMRQYIIIHVITKLPKFDPGIVT